MDNIYNNIIYLSLSQRKGFSLLNRKFMIPPQCHPWHSSFLPKTVSLVSPGAEWLCKLKPFGLIDQILPTNASSKSWTKAIVQFSKLNILKRFLLWVLVSFESQALLISTILVCTFICGGELYRGPDFPQTLSGYVGSLKPITSFGKIHFMRNRFWKIVVHG